MLWSNASDSTLQTNDYYDYKIYLCRGFSVAPLVLNSNLSSPIYSILQSITHALHDCICMVHARRNVNIACMPFKHNKPVFHHKRKAIIYIHNNHEILQIKIFTNGGD